MCGRYRLTSKELAIALASGMVRFVEFSELKIPFVSGQFIPSNFLPIIRIENGQPISDTASWGFVPSWSTGQKIQKPINAKSETVATSGMFRQAFRLSRCLIPATGFFEPKGPKTMKHRPQFYFHRPDEKVFAMAGIVSNGTVAILTTTPNQVLEPIHNRMPVIVDEADYEKWLNAGTSAGELQAMMKPSQIDLAVEPENKPDNSNNDEPSLF